MPILLRGGQAVMAIIAARGRLVLAQRAPAGPVFDDPVEKSFLKTNVVTHLFAFDPFMAQDLGTFSKEFLIKRRFVEHIIAFLCG